MKNKKLIIKIAILAALISLLLSACAPKKLESDRVLYIKGVKEYEKKNYDDAAEAFKTLVDNYPDSSYIAEARLKKADSYFYDKKYTEAIDSYEQFLKFHPANKDADRAQYQIGLSHFNDILAIDRDTTPTTDALTSFEKVLKEYPNSSYIKEAKEKINICRNKLVEREMYVGKFYLGQDKYIAARQRFQYILAKYSDLDIYPSALFYLAETYRLEDRTDEARLFYARLLKEFPSDSEYYKKARSKELKIKN